MSNDNWGLGIGDWGLGPIPNPQSPNPQYKLFSNYLNIINKFCNYSIIYIIYKNINFIKIKLI